MKKSLHIIIILVSTFIFLNSFASTKLSEEERLNQGEIVSSIVYTQDKQIAIVDVKAMIDTSPEKLWVLFTKIDEWKNWMPLNSEGWIIDESLLGKYEDGVEKIDDVRALVVGAGEFKKEISNRSITHVTTYEEYNLPWPLTDDWVLRGYEFDATKASSGKYLVTWKQLFKDTKRRGGSWRITDHGEDTFFEYHFRIKRKKGVPKAIFTMIIKRTIDKFIESIRESV